MKTTTSPITNSVNRSSVQIAFLQVPFAVAFAWFTLAPQARAVCQQGCLTTGNTVLGDNAFLVNTSGSGDTAIGANALQLNTTGFDNTATGWQALPNNTTGSFNTANGASALSFNTTGGSNTAIGHTALLNNNGNNSTAVGFDAMYFNTMGSENTAIGDSALLNNDASNNIAVGAFAGSNLTTGNFNLDIGNAGVAGESKTIRIGTRGAQRNTFIAGISGVTVANGVGVIIDNSGHLGTVVSSEKFKEAIKPMNKTSEAIFSLKPVTFRYKKELDPEGIPQFGLVAEEVEKVNPDLVARDDQGKPYTVRYEAVNAMLLNEFLKEHRTVQELKNEIAALAATVKEQAAQIQKVSAQREVNKIAPRIVLNNQ